MSDENSPVASPPKRGATTGLFVVSGHSGATGGVGLARQTSGVDSLPPSTPPCGVIPIGRRGGAATPPQGGMKHIT